MSRRLVCVLSHPTQFDPPLWACLTRRGQLVPIVYYETVKTPDDPEIAREVAWAHRPGDGYALFTGTLRDLCKELGRMRPPPAAILTSGWTRGSTWRAGLAAKRLGIPVIVPSDKVLLNDPRAGWQRSTLAVFHAVKNRFFDGFLTTGTLGLAAIEGQGVARARVARGLYAVDTGFWERRLAELAPFSASLRSWAGQDTLIVLAVSKLAERENPLLAVDTFARFERQHRSRLVLVGDGPLKPAVVSRIAELGLGDRVLLAGYVPYTDLAGYYGAADVFLHAPNVGPWEISLSEAMACGVPVVSTPRVGSAWDLIVQGETGAVAEHDDPADLAEALSAVAKMHERGHVSAAAKARAARVGVEAAAAEIEALADRLSRPIPSMPLFRSIRVAVSAQRGEPTRSLRAP